MKQIAFLIDASWLQDEETTVGVRYSCLQLLTAWPGNRCKFGYLVFNSEGSRAQKVQPVDFAAPLTNLVEEFEAQLRQGPPPPAGDKPAPPKPRSATQLETIRWAVSRSVTDFGWHSVSVCSPVKASRKRRPPSAASAPSSQQSIASHRSGDDDDRRNLLFIFARMPPGTLARIRDELVTSSLAKCLQESRIELVWVHDSNEGVPTSATSSKCLFLRMRDLVQLCGFFPTECAHHSAMMAPPTLVVARLLQGASGVVKSAVAQANCTISFGNGSLSESFSVTVVPVHASSLMAFEGAASELTIEMVVEEPTVASVLHRSQAAYFATSTDVHFHRVLAELKASRKVALLACGRRTFMLKAAVDSIGALISLTDKGVTQFKFSEVPPDSSFHGVLLERWLKVGKQHDVMKKVRTGGLVGRLASTYELATDMQSTEPEFRELEVEPLADSTPVGRYGSITCAPENYNSESALLQGLRHTYGKAVEGKLSPTTSAQSIVSAIVHYFESDFEKVMVFIEQHFKPPLESTLDKTRWASECKASILISFEVASLTSTKTDGIKARVVATMRKLLFLTSPRELFDFIRETLKGLYLDTVRPLLEDLAEEFDLPLFPESDTEEEMSPVESFADPMSGISSLGGGSVLNVVPCSAPIPTSLVDSQKAAVLRRLSSANLSQQMNQPRQIAMPRRRSVRTNESAKLTNPPAADQSPQKRASSTQVPTTPKGKRILKTRVVPETPVAKQAPNRVQRNQERLRRRSSILNSSLGGSALEEDDVDEIEESPVKGSARKASRSPPKKGRIDLTPTKENVVVERQPGTASALASGPSPTRKSHRATPRKHLTRQLRFSPQKKAAFSSPTAISLLHLTTSPVLYRPSRKRSAPPE